MKTYTDDTRGLYFDIIQGDYPVYTKPAPTTDDYNRGYITRYFAKKINDGTIYEVKTYSGVREDNLSSIRNAEKLMPGISGVLKDPLEFYR